MVTTAAFILSRRFLFLILVHRYILLNKPYGVLSQFTADVPDQRTLAEFSLPENVYAAGRLDADSEGLLLLTDDGPLIKRLLTPGVGHERTYHAQLEGEIDERAIAALSEGVRIGEYRTLPARAKRIHPEYAERIPPIRYRKSIPTSWIELALLEGKNRQVRRMTAAVGFPTLRLIRVAIGPLTLGGLPEGNWRDITPAEVQALLRSDIRATLTKRPRH